MCHANGSVELMTFAFPRGQRAKGYVLIQSVGNSEVMTANEMACVESDVVFKPLPPGRDI